MSRLQQYYQETVVPQLQEKLQLNERYAGAEDLEDHFEHGRW